MKLLPGGMAYGRSAYATITVESTTSFTWDEGRQFAEQELDIFIHTTNQWAKLNKSPDAAYQTKRGGPIEATLRGICKDATKMGKKWYCNYCYKGQEVTSEDYLGSMWWATKKPTMTKLELETYIKEMGDDDNETLY